jgi:hypothetical protein
MKVEPIEKGDKIDAEVFVGNPEYLFIKLRANRELKQN